MNALGNATLREMNSLMGLSGYWKKITKTAMERKAKITGT
jgi:hypothetical protein